MTTELAVEAVELTKRFGPVKALIDVSLRVPAGSVLAVLGRNGAGKTTALRILTTLLRPDSGTARVCGHDVTRDPTRVRSLIGVTGQDVALDPALSGRQNLRFVARLHHLGRTSSRRRADELIDRLNLTDAADRAVATYSGGMRRRVDVAAGLIGGPRVLFLDEPTTGLDPVGRHEVWDLITNLVEDGTTVVLTTQYLEEADQHADQIAIINAGTLVAAGTPNELKAKLPASPLEIELEDPSQVALAKQILARYSKEAPEQENGTGHLTATVTGGVRTVVAVAADFDAVGIKLVVLALRRPSLDDAFLAITNPLSSSR